MTEWWSPLDRPLPEPKFARVYVPGIEIDDVLDDVFVPIGRDGAGLVEVGIKIQRVLSALHALDRPGVGAAALCHAQCALSRSEKALHLPPDMERLRQVSCCVTEPSSSALAAADGD